MNSNIINNVADPLSSYDVATKNYVDANTFTTAVGVVSGDIKLIVGSNLARSLGCNNLTKVRSWYFCWAQTELCYRSHSRFRITSAYQDKN